MISDGNTIKHISLYKPIIENEIPLWAEFKLEEGDALPLLKIRKALCFKYDIQDDTIRNFINNLPSIMQLIS